ncbi:MAG: tetratricopeptide repeat protein [Myxococcales bacterium]|nr:tetratricopeptide repeat protein [Myxococcales bacterium]
MTQTMRATPETRPPVAAAPPIAPPTPVTSAPAQVYAAPAVPHLQTTEPASATIPQQVLRPDAPTSPPATPRPAQQLKALRPDGSRALPDRYTLGRSGLDDNNDEWRVGDKPMDLPHEPGDGRAPRSETLDVPQLPGTKPLYKVLAVAGLIAVVAVAAIVLSRPSSQTAPESDAEGSTSSDGVAAATDAGATLAGQLAADGSSEGSASSADGSAAEASAGEASAAEASAAAPPTAAVTPDARPRTEAAPTRRPAPAQPAEDDYDALMERAERALSARRYNDAVDLFAEAAEQSNRAEAHVGAGRAYAGLRQWHVAAARFQRAIDRNPRYMPAWYELGNARSQSGDTAGAVAAWQRVVDESRDQQLVRRAQSAIDGAQ